MEKMQATHELPWTVRTGIAALALASVALSGCGGGQSGAAEVVEGAGQTADGSGDAEASADLDLPRSATYGGWEWTVENATTQEGQVTLDITVLSTLQVHNGRPVRLDDVSLLDGDGVAMSQVPSFDASPDQLELDMPPGGRAEGTLRLLRCRVPKRAPPIVKRRVPSYAGS